MTALLPELRPGDDAPMVAQIERFYGTAIRDGSLRAGDRLPTIRAVADHVGVTRATVQQAYRRLAEAGRVVSTVGRGTVVSSEDSSGDRALRSGPIGRFALDTWRHLQESGDTELGADDESVRFDFADLRPDPELFPIEDFRASIERELRDHGAALLAYGDPSGSHALRTHLATCPDSADAPTDPDQILITSGAQQGIDLVIRTMTTPGAAVAAAVPTYHQLFGTLKAFGVRIAPVLCDDSGRIDLDDLRAVLRREDVRLFYVMPTFHNPTGRTIDVEQRRALVDIAVEAGVPILEDEFECELRIAGEPLPSLRSMDPRGWTSTVRTFSKGLFPGVRVGWVHAGRELLGPLTAMKRFADLGTSPLVQAGLADFVRHGGMDRHLANVRDTLHERHAAAQRALALDMPEGVRWTAPEGGFALWIDLPPGTDGRALARAAMERGVAVKPGAVFDPFGHSDHGLRLSLSRVDAETVTAGIGELAECVRSFLAKAPSQNSKPPLFL